MGGRLPGGGATLGRTLLGLATSLGLCAAACGQGQAPGAVGSDAASSRRVAREQQRRLLDPLREGLRRTLTPGRSWQLLGLSGGGQWGAFGAGFMKGWTERGTRPEFRVVTGTSTGSLIATFAFLGPSHDEALRDAYLGIRGDQDIFDSRFLLTAVFRDALATTGPLRRRLERFITPDVVAAVAREGARGRRLFVGAVDLDRGLFKPWDLTAIAGPGGEGARRLYIDALMASAAIPVAFPPVGIEGATYVDGGVRRNVFIQVATEEVKRARNAGAEPEEPTVYALVNGTLDVGSLAVKRRVLDIARRSVDILLDESTEGNLLRMYLQAQRAGLAFQMTRIPPGACDAIGSAENRFDPALMHCLYDEGRRFARDGASPWVSEPPLEDGP